MNSIFFIFLSGWIQMNLSLQNIRIPSCHNCIYYLPKVPPFDPNDGELGRCLKFVRFRNAVTKKETYEYAESCRTYSDKCGETGKFFKNANISTYYP